MLGEMSFQLTRRTFVGATAAFASRPTFAEDAPIATTTLGKVRGYIQSGVQCFKGIPYGADTATTRFQPPKKALAWSDVKECIQWSTRAPQGNAASASMRPRPNTANPTPRRAGGFRLPPDRGPESEDCLHLNVWTTGLRDHRKRPVLCYFHGGAYNNGTVNSELYDGVSLARTGEVVVVTVNHRLNSFGYLYLAELGGPSFSDSGNSGQLDLILSLEWIRDNIAEFGGDPTRVLIFGQSGGGAKCATLMAQPKAHNLFHRVVTMSGQQVVGVKTAVATQRAERVIAGLGLTRASLNDILILPWQKIQQSTHLSDYYGPVTDGRSLPRDPFAPDAPALSRNIPMILGNVHDESRALVGGGDVMALTWEQVVPELAKSPQFFGTMPLTKVVARYREIYPNYQPWQVYVAALTAFRAWPGQRIEAERRAVEPLAKDRTWVYQMNWPTPIGNGRLGSPHTLDIPFMFDNTSLAPNMVGNDPTAAPLAKLMSQTLIHFAQTGNPNHSGLPHWPTYDLTKRATMIWDKIPSTVNDPRTEERKLAEQVEYIQPA